MKKAAILRAVDLKRDYDAAEAKAQSAEAKAAEAKRDAFLERQQRLRDDARDAARARERRARDARELFASRPAAVGGEGDSGGGAAADAAAAGRHRAAFFQAVVDALRSLSATPQLADGFFIDLLVEARAPHDKRARHHRRQVVRLRRESIVGGAERDSPFVSVVVATMTFMWPLLLYSAIAAAAAAVFVIATKRLMTGMSALPIRPCSSPTAFFPSPPAALLSQASDGARGVGDRAAPRDAASAAGTMARFFHRCVELLCSQLPRDQGNLKNREPLRVRRDAVSGQVKVDDVLARFADPAFACDGTRFLKKLNVTFVRDVDARYLGRICSVRIASLHNEA